MAGVLVSPLTVFLGTVVLGESVILAAAALAAQGSWSIWSVAVAAFTGTILSDATWFLLAGRLVDRIERDPDRSARLRRHAARLDNWTAARPHLALLFGKFVYGTRILSIAYLSARDTHLKRFLGFDAIGTVIWLAVILPIGYAAGRGIERAGVDLARVDTSLVAVVVAAIAIRGVTEWRRRNRDTPEDRTQTESSQQAHSDRLRD